MSILEGQSIFRDFLERHGPGLYRTRSTVPGFDERSTVSEAAGIHKIASGFGVHVGSKWTYFDTTRLLQGLMVELRAEWPPRGEDDWVRPGTRTSGG